MADSDTAPVSPTESTPARTPAPKDKHCPYCDQLFTSSSLGRHLDLYIKEKNPKPADNVHDIEEIRKLRGGITRRSARSSSVKRESLTPANPKASPVATQRSTSDGPPPSSTVTAASKAPVRGLHEPSWQVTGVIRDIPQASNDPLPRLDGRRDSMRKYSVKSGVEHKEKLREALDNGRAAELALREVLDSLKIATLRARPPPSPLPFDVFVLTFPALVLQCLNAPPTLYATQPFPTHTSWSLEPPGEMQLHALVEYLRTQYRQWKTEIMKAEGRTDRSGSLAGRPRDYVQLDGGKQGLTASAAQEQEDAAVKHALDAYNHWDQSSETQKQEGWRLEILRAFSREKEKRQEVDIRLEETLQDVEHCKAQVDRLSRCQQPREFFLKPPTAMPLPKQTLRELNGSSSTTPDWDYDRLLSKWRIMVQENRRSVSGMAGQRPLMSTSQDSYQSPSREPPLVHPSRLTNGSIVSFAGAPPSAAAAPAPPINGEADDNDRMEDDPPEPEEERSPPTARGSISVPSALMHRSVAATTAAAVSETQPRRDGSISMDTDQVRPRGSVQSERLFRGADGQQGYNNYGRLSESHGTGMTQ